MINAYLPSTYQKNNSEACLKSLWAIAPAWHNLRQIIPSLQHTHPLQNIQARSFKHLVTAILLFIPVVSSIVVIALRRFASIDGRDFEKNIDSIKPLSAAALTAMQLAEEGDFAELRLWKSASGATLDRFGSSLDNWKKEQTPNAEQMQGYNLPAAGRLFARNLRSKILENPTALEERMAKMLDNAIDLQAAGGLAKAQERLQALAKGEELLIYGGVPGHAIIERIECIAENNLELTTYNSGIGSWNAGIIQDANGTKVLKGYHSVQMENLKTYDVYQKGKISKSSIPKVCTHLVTKDLNKKELSEFLITASLQAILPPDYLTRDLSTDKAAAEMHEKIKNLYEGINKLIKNSPIPNAHPLEFRRAQRSGFCVSRSLFALYFHLNVKHMTENADKENFDTQMQLAKKTFKKNHLKQKTTFLLAVVEQMKTHGPTHLLSINFLNNLKLTTEKYWKEQSKILDKTKNFEYAAIFHLISNFLQERRLTGGRGDRR